MICVNGHALVGGNIGLDASMKWRGAAAIAAWLACAGGAAAPLSAADPSYDFEVTRDAEARSCRVALVLLGGQDSLSFRLIYTYDTQQDVTLVGFSVNLAEQRGGSGAAPNVQMVALSSAQFAAPSFDSSDQLNGGPVDDGGVVLGTVNEQIANALIAAFFAGNFEVSVTTRDREQVRAYKVSAPPPDDLRQQWDACTQRAQ